MPIILEVNYRVKPGMREELLKIVKDNVDNTRKEAGNIKYTHYASIENEQDMFVFEMWESVAHVEAHIHTEHYLEFANKRKPMLEKYDYKIYEVKLVQEGETVDTW